MKPPASTLAYIIAAVSVTAAFNVATPAKAQTSSASGAGEIGKQIATSGAGAAAACASCHGPQGEGMAASNFPRIAGQPHAYLARQLTSYANGNRNNPVMSPIAKALTEQQIAAVSIYYASLEAPSKPATTATPPKRGQTLADLGDEKIGVQGCINCHGPGGIGQPPLYPYLAGQYMGYLVTALGEWKSGARKTDPSKQMNLIAQRLSDDDMKSVAAYYAAQPAPPPTEKLVNIPAGSAARPVAPGPQPGQPSPPTKGVGVEQGPGTPGTGESQQTPGGQQTR
jgi:cytochrome c553